MTEPPVRTRSQRQTGQDTWRSSQRSHYEVVLADENRARWRQEHRLVAFYEHRLMNSLYAIDSRLPLPVLEVGCGQGQNLLDFATKGEEGRLVGTDVTASGLQCARRLRRERSRKSELDFVESDASRLPFHDNTFRLVYGRDLLHHVTNPAEVLREMKRVVAPGGTLAALEANILHPQFLVAALAIPTERGLMRSNDSRLRKLFTALDLEGTALRGFEFFPRMILLGYSSPFRSAFSRISQENLSRFAKLERLLESQRVLRSFSAYLLASGKKPGHG